MTGQSWVCLACGRRYADVRTFCGGCWAQGLIVDVGQRLPAAVDREPELTSARELARMTWQTIESRRYPEVKLGRGAFVVATGAPGNGKSSLAAGLLDGFPAPVLLLSVEEPPGPTLAGRLLRVGVRRDDFGVVGHATVDQVVDLLRQTKVAALGIDSIQPSMFTARDVRHLLAVVPTLAVIVATAQVNADGHIAGVRAVEHEADVVLDVEAMRWRLRKSRYQETGLEGDVRVARAEGEAA
jgi:predicted ATP-dependent serine protease